MSGSSSCLPLDGGSGGSSIQSAATAGQQRCCVSAAASCEVQQHAAKMQLLVASRRVLTTCGMLLSFLIHMAGCQHAAVAAWRCMQLSFAK